MRRRKFITLVGGAVASPFVAHAQQGGPMRRVAFLIGLPPRDPEGQRWVRTFVQALRDLGWRNGTNVQIDLRWAGNLDQMRMSAQELVELRPEVIHVATALAAVEVLRKTRTLPIVFSVVNDPVSLGLVQSLQRPEGNATGFTNIDPSLGEKWLRLIKEIAPPVTRVAVLFNPTPGSPFEQRWPRLRAAAESLGIAAEAMPVRNLSELEKSLDGLGLNLQVGIIFTPDQFFNLTRAEFVTSIVSRHRVVAVYPVRDFAMAGGLVSYSVDAPDLQRRAAGYVDRILKGEAPAELPVQGPDKFELVINLKTAKAIGLSVPRSLIARASEVIE